MAMAVKDSGVGRGVGVGSAGVSVVGTGSEVAGTGVEVTSGAGLWPMQAASTMRNARKAQSGSLVIRVVASFSPETEARLQVRNPTSGLQLSILFHLMGENGRRAS